MLISITVTILLSGCGNQVKDKDAQAGNINMIEAQNDCNQMKIEHYKLQNLYQKAVVKNGIVYGAYVENGLGKVEIENYIENTCYEICFENVDEVLSVSVDESGKIYIWGSFNDEYSLWDIDPENNSIVRTTDIEVENEGLFSEVRNVFVDSEGYIYLWYNMTVPCEEVFENGESGVYSPVDRIYVKDCDLKTVSYDEIPNSYGDYLVSVLLGENGEPYFLAKDSDGYYEKTVRNKSDEESTVTRINLGSELNENLSHFFKTSGGYIYISDGDIYEYDLASGDNKLLWHLATAGIYENDIIFLDYNDGQVEIIDNYNNYDISELTIIGEGVNEKTQVRIATVILDETTRKVIADFNRWQNDIIAVPVVYAENYDYDDGIEKLKLDILKGDAPDLFFTEGIDYECFIKNGVLQNMYAFMDEDGQLCRDDIMECINEAYSYEDSLYTLAPSFVVHTMWGNGDVLANAEYSNLNELCDILEKNGGGAESIYGLESADESALKTFLAIDMDSYVNWEESTCDFMCEDFYELLSAAKEYKGEGSNGGLYLSIQNKDILCTYGVLTSVEDYCIQKKLYGDNIAITGYPTKIGFGSSVSLISPVAINSNSENKQAAWEFVKYYVMNGYEKRQIGFPVCETLFDDVLEKAAEIEFVDTESGYEKIAKAYYHEKDIVDFVVYNADYQDIEEVRQLVYATTEKYEYVTAIQKIIEEEAEAYFCNQKTVTEVSEIIQSRVGLYLAE